MVELFPLNPAFCSNLTGYCENDTPGEKGVTAREKEKKLFGWTSHREAADLVEERKRRNVSQLIKKNKEDRGKGKPDEWENPP